MTVDSQQADQRPFANGTERDAWTSRWCEYCVHDHDMHPPDEHGPGCDLIVHYWTAIDGDDWRMPEAWLPEPDDGQFALPSRMCCLMFTPCEPCGGDPGKVERAERVAEVQAYWRSRGPRRGTTGHQPTEGEGG